MKLENLLNLGKDGESLWLLRYDLLSYHTPLPHHLHVMETLSQAYTAKNTGLPCPPSSHSGSTGSGYCFLPFVLQRLCSQRHG